MTEVPNVTRHQLDLPVEVLEQLRRTVDAATGVRAAREAMAHASRSSCLKQLRGRNVLESTLVGRKGLNVIKMRHITMTAPPRVGDDDVPPPPKLKPKPRQGRCNWPRNKEERLAWELRKSQRRQKEAEELKQLEQTDLLLQGGGGTSVLPSDVYRPTADELIVLNTLRERLAQRMGVTIAQLGEPDVLVTCIREGEQRVHNFRSSKLASSIAVDDATASIEFLVGEDQIVRPPPMDPGDALVYPLAKNQRVPRQDWRVQLFFHVKPNEEAAVDGQGDGSEGGNAGGGDSGGVNAGGVNAGDADAGDGDAGDGDAGEADAGDGDKGAEESELDSESSQSEDDSSDDDDDSDDMDWVPSRTQQ